MDGVLEITEKVLKLSSDSHWEVKTQCMNYAILVLKHLADCQSKMAGKEDKFGIPKGAGGGGKKPESA